MKKGIISILLGLALFSSCMEEIEDIITPSSGEEKVSVLFDLNLTPTESKVKSRFSFDENTINDYFILVYDQKGNNVFHWSSLSDTSAPAAELTAGRTYTVYCVANNGKMIDNYLNEEAIKSYAILHKEFSRTMIMTGCESITPTKNTLFKINLKRCFAKINITIHSDYFTVGGGISQMFLKNAPMQMYPFDATRKADTYGLTDWQGTEFNFDETITFYCLENMQGTLLPGNTDPWAKVPDNLGDVANQCTYIEFLYSKSDMITGSVSYKFYLGEDNCSNFDICRNTVYTVDVTLSNDLYKSSWKVTPTSFGYQTGLISGTVTSGHDLDMYVGERFDIDLDARNDLIRFLNGDLSSSQPNPEWVIRVYENGKEVKDAIILYTEWECSAYSNSSDTDICSFNARYECRKTVTNADVYITDSHGTKVASLASGLSISNPRLMMHVAPMISNPNLVLTDTSGSIAPQVNGKKSSRSFYLVDKTGKSLDATSIDFNREYFQSQDVKIQIKPSSKVLGLCGNSSAVIAPIGSLTNADNLFSTEVGFHTQKYYPLMTITFSASNVNTPEKNALLSRLYLADTDNINASALFSSIISVGNLKYEKATTFDIVPLNINFYEEGHWTNYADGGYPWFCVSNPSHIDLDVTAAITAVNKSSEAVSYYSFSGVTDHLLAGPSKLNQPIIGKANRIICAQNYNSERTYTDSKGLEYLCYQLFDDYTFSRISTLSQTTMMPSLDCAILSLSGQEVPIESWSKLLYENWSDGVVKEAAAGIWGKTSRRFYSTENTRIGADILNNIPEFSPQWLYAIFKNGITEMDMDFSRSSTGFFKSPKFTSSKVVSYNARADLLATTTYKQGPSKTATKEHAINDQFFKTESELKTIIGDITKNYWMGSWHTVIATHANIYATFAKVKSTITLDYYSITTNDWYIIDYSNAKVADVVFGSDYFNPYHFNERTVDGCLPEWYNKNPDNTVRFNYLTFPEAEQTGYICDDSYMPDPFKISIPSIVTKYNKYMNHIYW